MISTVNRGAGALICIPTYNESENIARIVPAILEQVPEAHILVVDDNSPDGTGKLADRLAEEDERVQVLHRDGKAGLGKAYIAAFQWALKHDYLYVFEFDADFSHDPMYLPRFVGLLADGVCDVIVGSRRIQGGRVEGWPLPRRFISWVGSMYARVVLGTVVMDMTGGFNGFSRDVLTRIPLHEVASTGYCFQIELKYRASKYGFCVREEPIIFRDRVLGNSKMSTSILSEALVQVWRLRRMKITGIVKKVLE